MSIGFNPWQSDTSADDFVEAVNSLPDDAIVMFQIEDPNNSGEGLVRKITGATLKTIFSGTPRGAGDGLNLDGNDLEVLLDGATLSVSASGLKITAGGVGTTQLANGAVNDAKFSGRLTPAKRRDGYATITSSDYTVNKTNDESKIVWVNTSNGNRTVNLPNMESGDTGYELIIVKQSSGNTLTVDGNGNQEINGAATYVLNNDREVAVIKWSGTAWDVIVTSNRTTGGSLDINGLTAETYLQDADALAFYDNSAAGNRKMTAANFANNLRLPTFFRHALKDIAQSVLRSAHSSIVPQGITWDGSSVLVADNNQDAIWGFTNGARDTSKDIAQSVLRSANASIDPRGLAWDGSSVLVADINQDTVWGFTNGARDTSKDIAQSVLRSAHSSIDPRGLAWDGSSVLVLDSNQDAVWGFTNGARDTSKDIAQSVLRSANSGIVPQGITWDGSSVLVLDNNQDTIWGFTNGARDTSKDIAQSLLQSANTNISPEGLAWDGGSVLVLDSNQDAVWGFSDRLSVA